MGEDMRKREGKKRGFQKKCTLRRKQVYPEVSRSPRSLARHGSDAGMKLGWSRTFNGKIYLNELHVRGAISRLRPKKGRRSKLRRTRGITKTVRKELLTSAGRYPKKPCAKVSSRDQAERRSEQVPTSSCRLKRGRAPQPHKGENERGSADPFKEEACKPPARQIRPETRNRQSG